MTKKVCQHRGAERNGFLGLMDFTDQKEILHYVTYRTYFCVINNLFCFLLGPLRNLIHRYVSYGGTTDKLFMEKHAISGHRSLAQG